MIQLDAMILVPAVFALLSLTIGRRRPSIPRWVALVAVLVQTALFCTLLPAGVLAGARMTGASVPGVGAIWLTSIDGLSTPFVLLTLFIGAAAVLASWRLPDRPGSYFALILALQAAVSAVFLAENLVLFYVAWESVLIPMYFLIGGWGSSNRRHAATKYLLFTFAAGAVMLFGVILALQGRAPSANISDIARFATSIPAAALVFWLFMIAFLVKLPVVPLHTWLPDAHTEAPTAGSIILAGVLLKMGGYGILRIGVPFAPHAFDSARPLLATLGVVGIVYGAAMALVQTDLKRLVAYSSVSHMGFVMLAIAAATADAFGASVVAMVSHGFVAGLLFLLVGSLYDRTHTRELDRFGGLGRVMPVWGVAFTFGALASLGLPGLSGFPGEFATVLESFRVFGWWIVVGALGLVLAAAYNLRAVRNSVHGVPREFSQVPDLSAREIGLSGAFAVVIVTIGLQPMIVLSISEQALRVLARIAAGGV